MPERELVTITEACKRVKVCRRTIYYWITTGKIDVVRTAGGNLRIYADTLTHDVPTTTDGPPFVFPRRRKPEHP